MRHNSYFKGKSILILLLIIITFLVCYAGKKQVEQYSFDEFTELIGLKKGDPHLKSVVKNKNYKFKYNKKDRIYTSKKRGIKIQLNWYKDVEKIEFSFQSFGEKYTGNLPYSCIWENVIDSLDWYKESKTKYHTGYKKDYMIFLNVTGDRNHNQPVALSVGKTEINWIDKPPMQDCQCDDTPIEELTGDFEGDKILDYVGRHKTDPILVALIENSPLEFKEDKYGDYRSKGNILTIKFSKNHYVSDIYIRKGFNRKVPGNITMKNILSCRNWDYGRHYNTVYVKYRNYLISIPKKSNNEIKSISIKPTDVNREKEGANIVIVEYKYDKVNLEGDVLLQLLGLPVNCKFVQHILKKYSFTKEADTYYNSKSLGIAIFVKKGIITEISAHNSDGEYFKGALPYSLTFESFSESSDLEFKKIKYGFEAFKDWFRYYAASDDGEPAEFIAISKVYTPVKSGKISSSLDKKEYKSTMVEGELLLKLIGESIYDDFIDFVFDKFSFVKGDAESYEEENNYYSSGSLGLGFLTNKKTEVIEKIFIGNKEDGKFTGRLPYDISLNSFISNPDVKFRKMDDIYAAKKGGYIFIAKTSDEVKADYILFQKAEETKKSNKVAVGSSNSKYEQPDYSISKIISVTSDKLKANGWNYVKQKVSYTPVKGYDQYSLDLEFNTFPNNLYVVTVVYTDNIVEYCNTFINGQHIKAESNDHAEGYRLLTHPFRSGQGGHIKTSATIHFPFIDKNKYETDFAIVVYRKPI